CSDASTTPRGSTRGTGATRRSAPSAPTWRSGAPAAGRGASALAGTASPRTALAVAVPLALAGALALALARRRPGLGPRGRSVAARLLRLRAAGGRRRVRHGLVGRPAVRLDRFGRLGRRRLVLLLRVGVRGTQPGELLLGPLDRPVDLAIAAH